MRNALDELSSIRQYGSRLVEKSVEGEDVEEDQYDKPSNILSINLFLSLEKQRENFNNQNPI